ncbi:MAG: DUF2075 domain-containing protein, partial [Actinomycetota bacterium]|nr:DUF2075 domain-containing protein [Actinomycetota bacterium]
LVRGVSASGINEHRSAQIYAWEEQTRILKAQLSDEAFHDWYIVLEYELPRRSRRPDVVLLGWGTIFVVEFKVGATRHDAAARWQARSYALDLRDFHAESQGRTIVPVLCATKASTRHVEGLSFFGAPTGVAELVPATGEDLGALLLKGGAKAVPHAQKPIDPIRWVNSAYRPTPTIVEAAVRLYEGHGVREISHRHARNLDATASMLVRVIDEARRERRKVVCFVTGIPGAGKTLTGLEVVHDPGLRGEEAAAGIFLSGNGPLVKVVREALVMSQVAKGRRREDCEYEVTTFIQNVHRFLRHHREQPRAVPHEHVVVFDEAQRAWDRAQMKRKERIDAPEATLLLEVMERLPDWAVVIALVGGGQEIFLGEAGLEEWGRAIAASSTPWHVVASPEVLAGGGSVAGHRLFADGIPDHVSFSEEPLAHLDVGVRSHRAGQWAEWVNDLLALRTHDAQGRFPDPHEFPCVVTRDLDRARAWLHEHGGRDPLSRSGLVATSQDQRLRAHGIESSSAFRRAYSFDKWFLAAPEDVRSSFSLEVAASEFECQGLELDWVGVCWGGDLTPADGLGAWDYRSFKGSRWQNVRQDAERAYVRNRYRVLLTRARQGMVIWVPPGADDDPTRDPKRFDRLYDTLRAAGVPDLDEG